MRQRIAKSVPFTGHRRVQQQKAGHGRQRELIGHVDAARPADPVQLGVKQHQPHQPEPENRHRIPDQPDDAHHLIDQLAAPYRRPHAQRHAQPRAEQDTQAGQFHRRRKRAADVLHHRVGGQHRDAKITAQHLAQVDVKLRVQRLVQPHFLARPGHDMRRRVVADHGQHRIDRNHPADEKRDREQAQVGQQNHHQKAPKGVQAANMGRWAGGPGHRQRRRTQGEGIGSCQARWCFSRHVKKSKSIFPMRWANYLALTCWRTRTNKPDSSVAKLCSIWFLFENSPRSCMKS